MLLRALFVVSALIVPPVLVLCRDLSPDEHMYVAAGVLTSQDMQVYADFAYFQTPYLPHCLAWVFQLTGGVWLLLSARLFAVGAGVVSLILVRWMCTRLSDSVAVGDLCGVLIASHHLFLFVLPLARNHVVAAALLVGGFACVVRVSIRHGNPVLWCGLAGLCAGLAVGFKLTALPLAGVIVVLSFFCVPQQAFRQRLMRGCAPAGIGFFIAVLPACWMVWAIDFEVLWFNNYAYHHLNLLRRLSSDDPGAVTLVEKAVYIGIYLIKGSGAALLIALLGALVWIQARGVVISDTKLLIGWVIAVVVALLSALLPSPSHRDYLLMMPIVSSLWLATLLKPLWPLDPKVRQLSIALGVGSFAVAMVMSMRDYRVLLHPTDCPPIVTARVGKALAEQMPPDSMIMTFCPIYVLEGGVQIPPECATGPFFFRIGEFLSLPELTRYVGVSPETLAQLVPPEMLAGVLIETDEALDQNLSQLACERDTQQVDLPADNLVLYRYAVGQ